MRVRSKGFVPEVFWVILRAEARVFADPRRSARAPGRSATQSPRRSRVRRDRIDRKALHGGGVLSLENTRRIASMVEAPVPAEARRRPRHGARAGRGVAAASDAGRRASRRRGQRRKARARAGAGGRGAPPAVERGGGRERGRGALLGAGRGADARLRKSRPPRVRRGSFPRRCRCAVRRAREIGSVGELPICARAAQQPASARSTCPDPARGEKLLPSKRKYTNRRDDGLSAHPETKHVFCATGSLGTRLCALGGCRRLGSLVGGSTRPGTGFMHPLASLRTGCLRGSQAKMSPL